VDDFIMTIARKLAIAASFVSLALGPTLLVQSAAAQQPSGSTDDDQKSLNRALAKAKAAQAEVDRITARIRAQRGVRTQTAALAGSQKGAFGRGAEELNRQRGTPLKPPPEAQTPDNCNPQRLYVRADRIDNFLYPQTIEAPEDATGASISFIDDRVAAQKSLVVNGQVSYVLFRDLCPDMAAPLVPFVSGWAFVPWVSANGNYTSPRSSKEESAAKVGVDMQFELSFGIPFLNNFPLRQVFTVSPYHQTDFRGEANISGVTFSWTPYDARYHVGGYLRDNPYLGWFLQLSAEADIREVKNPGLTGLTDQSYSWVGGTARLTLVLFPFFEGVDPFIRNRLSFVFTDWFYHDLRSGMDINKYSALLKYKLVPEGYSSLGFEYSHGTDKDTLIFADKYLVKLLVAY
jgi:hypothetical protein